MKRVTIILTLMTLLAWCFSAYAAEVAKERNNTLSLNQALQEIMKSQGVNDVKSIDCSKVTEKHMEDLGDAYMDVIHPDSSEHDFMDREAERDKVEVAAIDPIASMQAVQNPSLGEIAVQVQAKLKKAIDSL